MGRPPNPPHSTIYTPRLPKLPNNCTNSTCPPQMWKLWKTLYWGTPPNPHQGLCPCTPLINKPPITTCGGYWWLILFLPGFEGEDAVLAAEAEAVDEGGAHFPVAGLVGDVVEV